ncbi:MAG TPA: TlpA disulfide reductase family protein [Pyrinomonadaceae bacterium]|nr:TlpA disulfide reductase family protein [Pyrinomonadaceae bacterium]
MLKTKSFLFPILLFLSLGIGCATKTPAKNSISGEIKNLPAGTLQLILEEDVNRKKSRVIAEIPVDGNGRFKFEKELPPHIYSLKINDKKSVMLAVEKNQNIVITGDAAGSGQLQVTGSEDTAKLEAYEKFRKESLNRLVVSVRNQIKELKEKGAPENDSKLVYLAGLEIENYDRHKDELIEFIKKEMGTSLAIYPTSIRWDGEKNIPFLLELAKRFETNHPNTEIAVRINEKVKAVAANRIGGRVAEIKMPDKNGEIVPLSSINAKYILIDFWGSWCPPCRRESRLLGELYQKFKPEGFEIYGVGLESGKENWLKAIEQDKRIWTNVSTFQEFETPATFDYAVTSLPANVLIDNSGKVIAKNLHGTALKAAVEKLFLSGK